MTKMKIKLVCFFVVLAATLTLTSVQAQFDDPDPSPTNIPFDGGLSLVVAAGIAYAAKKGYNKRKVKKEAEK